MYPKPDGEYVIYDDAVEAIKQARKQAAREILADLQKCFFAVDFELVRDNIKYKFELKS
jgi:hypothetical protein